MKKVLKTTTRNMPQRCMCLIHSERAKSTPSQKETAKAIWSNELLGGNRNASREGAQYTANAAEKRTMEQFAEGAWTRLIQSSCTIRSEAIFQCASPRVDTAAAWRCLYCSICSKILSSDTRPRWLRSMPRKLSESANCSLLCLS
jgi:hypothetical protein